MMAAGPAPLALEPGFFKNRFYDDTGQLIPPKNKEK
jgi:hypothetical protein